MPITIGYRSLDFEFKSVEDKEIDKIKGTKILVINALRKEAHHSHFNLEEALDFIGKVKPKKAFLTHISHLLGFHREVEKELPQNVHLAFDNLQINI